MPTDCFRSSRSYDVRPSRYAETVRLLAAWCELRQDFRHFRTDRILAAEFLDENYGCRPSDLRTRWKRQIESGRGVRLS